MGRRSYRRKPSVEKEIDLMGNGNNKKLLMKRSKRILLAFLIALPALTFFFVLLYFFIVYYDELYTTFLGPLSGLFLLFIGAYALTLPFNINLVLQRFDIQTTIQKFFIRLLLIYLPLALMICSSVVLWVYFARTSMQWAAQHYFPVLETLIYFMTLLMVLQEVMKYLARKEGLSLYKGRHISARNLRWSLPVLRIVIVLQSVGFLLISWSLFALSTAGIRWLAQDYLSSFLLIMACLISMIIIIGLMIKLEQKLEKQGRDQLYIPWKS